MCRYPATMHGAYLSGLREAGNITSATIAKKISSTCECKIQKDLQLHSSTIEEIFKEPDLEFGSFSIIFDHKSNDPKSIALLRFQYGESKKQKEISDIELELESKTNEILGPKQQFHLYTTITRQQAYELREIRKGDCGRLAYLYQRLGTKLVGRRGLGPQGDALVVAIKWYRATRKFGVVKPPLQQSTMPLQRT